ENVICIVDQTFPESVKTAESLATSDQNIHFSRQPRGTFKIVSRKRLFQPIDTDLLERPGRGQARGIIPNRAGYVCGAVDHYFETRAAGREYPGAGLDVVHEVRAEDAHLECIEACVLEPAGIYGLVLNGHLRLIHIA